MVLGVYFYHGNIQAIVLAVTVPSALGYIAVFFLNLAHRRAQLLDIVPSGGI